MANPQGFLQFERALPAKRTVSERLQDYKEFTGMYQETELNRQSARCMDCGIPFCHHGCPLGNFIPDFNSAVYAQQYEKAWQILSSTNNFPEFTGRICPAPCESACVLGINQPAVTIEEIEKHIIEIAFEKGWVKPSPPIFRSGKKVAVIGSGPAGLAAAAQLNDAGHLVTVFERAAYPGGLLRYGIPDFKLEKWVVERRIGIMEAEGISFRCNAEVGRNIKIGDLLREYHAVVLAGGATIPRDLSIPGRDLNGVHFAMDFLTQQNKKISREDFEEKQISASGKNVVVIGGGDTGSDCIGTALRQHAASVLQFELLPKPPAERTKDMPWPQYPMILKTTSSHEEGAERFWAITTRAFIGDENGNLKALKIAQLEWSTNAEGKATGFNEIAGTEKIIPCELALLAMGFLHPQQEGLINELGIDLDARGMVLASEKNYQTSIAKIFTAGDMRRGQSLVVWAISEGRECAKKVDAFLSGKSELPSKDQSRLVTVSG